MVFSLSSTDESVPLKSNRCEISRGSGRPRCGPPACRARRRRRSWAWRARSPVRSDFRTACYCTPGSVPKWPKGTGCKPVAQASGVRIPPGPPIIRSAERPRVTMVTWTRSSAKPSAGRSARRSSVRARCTAATSPVATRSTSPTAARCSPRRIRPRRRTSSPPRPPGCGGSATGWSPAADRGARGARGLRRPAQPPRARVDRRRRAGASDADGERRFGAGLARLHAAGAPCFGREDRRTTGSRGLPNEPVRDVGRVLRDEPAAPARPPRARRRARCRRAAIDGARPGRAAGSPSSAAPTSRRRGCTATSGPATGSSAPTVGTGSWIPPRTAATGSSTSR